MHSPHGAIDWFYTSFTVAKIHEFIAFVNYTNPLKLFYIRERVFLTCLCHKTYRDEAIGLKSCKYTWKITIFVKMWHLG